MENVQPIEIDDAVVYAVPSKEKIEELSRRLITAVEEGHKNPLELLVKLRFAEQVIKQSIEGIESFCVDEASKYGKGEQIKLMGAELKIKEAGVKYDYSNCNHPVWFKLNQQLDQTKAELKGTELTLKSVKAGYDYTDETTGEIFHINPPAKTSKTIVEVSIK